MKKNGLNKLLALLLALVMVLALAACGNKAQDNGGAGDDVAELFPLAREGHEERADEERHYGQHGEVHIDVVCHPCSLLISRASSVPYSL